LKEQGLPLRPRILRFERLSRRHEEGSACGLIHACKSKRITLLCGGRGVDQNRNVGGTIRQEALCASHAIHSF
jgi:hypothetical protein